MTDLTPGLRDELVTAAAGEALLRVDDELIEMAELEGAEAPERFARHAGAVVRRVLERMRDDDASAEAQALAVNEIIGALTDEDVISLPPSVLTGVRRPAEGLGTSILPASPMIALSANELLVNGHAQPAIGQQIRSELPSATDVDFLVSFVRWTGVRTLIDELAQVVERGGRVRVITTTYMSATEPKALEELAKAGADVRVDYEADRTKLHAKAWIIHRPGGLTTAFLGSSNISYAALHQGMEWNVRLSEVATASLVERMRATFETYWANDAFEPFDPRGMASASARHSTVSAGRSDATSAAASWPSTSRPSRTRRECSSSCKLSGTATTATATCSSPQRAPARPSWPRSTTAGSVTTLGRKPSLLFVAHRRRILDQSRATYATVLKDPDFGEILGDGEQPLIGRHVFAMVQSLRNEAVEALDRGRVRRRHHRRGPPRRGPELPRAARAPSANRALGPNGDARTHGRRGHHALVRAPDGRRAPAVGGHRRRLPRTVSVLRRPRRR